MKARLAEVNDAYAQALIPTEIFFIDVQARLKNTFVALPGPMRDIVGGLIVLGSEFGVAAGQTALLLVNLSVLWEKMGPRIIKTLSSLGINVTGLGAKIDALKLKWNTAMSGMEFNTQKFRRSLAAVGLAAAAAVTGMLAMQEQEPGMRAFLSALTGLEAALAVTMMISAVAKSISAHALIPIVGVGIGVALGTYALAQFAAAKRTAEGVVNSQYGGLFPARPGSGTLARVGEGAGPEIVSPIPTMRETFREVIRETGGSVTINPTIHVAPFTSINRNALDVLIKSMTKETINELRRRGVTMR